MGPMYIEAPCICSIIGKKISAPLTLDLYIIILSFKYHFTVTWNNERKPNLKLSKLH